MAAVERHILAAQRAVHLRVPRIWQRQQLWRWLHRDVKMPVRKSLRQQVVVAIEFVAPFERAVAGARLPEIIGSDERTHCREHAVPRSPNRHGTGGVYKSSMR